MRRLILLSLILTFSLAACGTPTPTLGPLPTQPVGSYPAPANPTPAGDAYPAPTPAANPGGSIATFVIVPEETEASYSIEETFLNQNNALNTAIGRTSAVQGQLSLNYADPTQSAFGEFVVDISTLTSDRSMRDNRIRREWLESSKFPLATFTVKEVRNFPANPQEGQVIAFQLVGDLKIKETSREMTWDVTATLTGDKLTGVATIAFLLADFNIPVPNVAGILSVTDGLTVTLNFTFKKE